MSDEHKEFRGSEFVGYAPRFEPRTSTGASSIFERGEGAFLGSAVLGATLTTADIFFALLALPAVQVGLGGSDQALQLVVAIHSAAFASVLIAAGRLGDSIGANRVCMLGLGLMVAAATLATLAPSMEVFIVARGLQGIAAGCVTPQIIALVGTRFQGVKRRKAFAAFALAQALGAVLGQLVAGAIIETNVFGLGWRGPFALLAPAAFFGLVLMARYVDERRSPQKRPLDLSGTALCALLLVLITWSLTVGRLPEQGAVWLDGLLAAVLVGVIFGIHQFKLDRAGRHPMLPLQSLRNPRVRLGLLAAFVFYLGVLSFYWLVGIHSQRELQLSPWAAGCLFAVFGFGFTISTALGPRISARTQRQVLYWGSIGLAGAHGLGIVVSLFDPNIVGTAAYLFFAGVGIGSIMAPLMATVTSEADSRDAGAVAGLFGTVQATGNGLGASLVPIAYLSQEIGSKSGLPINGYGTSLLLLLLASLFLTLMIRRLLKGQRPRPIPDKGGF
ncbi:MAG: MFS transporter [Rubrivivax sp.]